jgi:hypothetical protein
MNDQRSDLFGFREPQGDLFANEAPRNAGIVSADPDHVRAKLFKMLAEARAARSALPWERADDASLSDNFSTNDELAPECRG